MTRSISLEYGATVYLRGRAFVIKQESLDFSTIVLADAHTGELLQAAIKDLAPGPDEPPDPIHDLGAIGDGKWEDALATFEIIKPLLDKPGRTKEDVVKRADECDVHYTSVYRWIRQYESTGRVSVFLYRQRKDYGKILLAPDVEAIVKDVIETKYLTQQRWSVAKIWREIEKICAKKKLPPPHVNTVRQRIKRLDPYRTTKAREGTKAAEAVKLLFQGKFPGADVPLPSTRNRRAPTKWKSVLILSLDRTVFARWRSLPDRPVRSHRSAWNLARSLSCIFRC